MYMNRDKAMEVINEVVENEGNFTDSQKEYINERLKETSINKLGEYVAEIIMDAYGIYLSDIMRDMEDGALFWDDCNGWALDKDAMDEEAEGNGKGQPYGFII